MHALATSFDLLTLPATANPATAATSGEREQRIARARVSHTVAVRQAFSAMLRGDASATRHTLVAVWARGDELMQLLWPVDIAIGEPAANDGAGRDGEQLRLRLMTEALKDVAYARLQEFNTRKADPRELGQQLLTQAVRRCLSEREPVEFARRMAAEAFDIFGEIDARDVPALAKRGSYEAIQLELAAVCAHVKRKWPAAGNSLDIFGLLEPAVQRAHEGLARWSEQ